MINLCIKPLLVGKASSIGLTCERCNEIIKKDTRIISLFYEEASIAIWEHYHIDCFIKALNEKFLKIGIRVNYSTLSPSFTE